MFAVYWLRTMDWNEDVPHIEQFWPEEMSDALKYMEELRRDPKNRFVTMCSENPNSVGKPGVADPSSDYNWTKRRTTKLRNSNDEVEVPVDE